MRVFAISVFICLICFLWLNVEVGPTQCMEYTHR